MGAATDVDILLLAAGAGARFGAVKQLAPIAGVAMVRHCAAVALATGARVTVVTGAHADAVTSSLAGLPLETVHNEHWQRGIGASIACGVRALLAGTTAPAAVLLHLADLPAVGQGDLLRLVETWRAAPERLVVAGFGPALGPPCLFPPRLFAALARLDGDRGARELVLAEGGAAIVVPVAGAGHDVDTAQDLADLGARTTPPAA